MRRKFATIGIAMMTAAMFAGCGQKTQVQETTVAVTETAPETSAAEETTEPAAETAEFKEGNYIDENENHLSLYYMTKADGYEKDGWAALAVIGEELYSGEMEEKDGGLAGDLYTFTSDGKENAPVSVSFKTDGENVTMVMADGKTYTFAPDDTDYAAMYENMLPMFQYNQLYAYRGFDNKYAAVYDYLSFDKAGDYGAENVMIPYAEIIDMDESKAEDVLIYGDYYLYEFAKNGDVLECVSGGHCPGIIHTERFGDEGNGIYAAHSMEEALTDDEAKELFGERYEAYEKIASNSEERVAGLAQVIADYVSANDLEVTKFKMSDGEEMELPESNAGKMHEKRDLPEYVYPDASSKEAAIAEYMKAEFAEELDAGAHDVVIPYAVIIGEEEKEDGNLRVLFTGWTMCYDLYNTTLEMASGREVSGALNLKKTDAGYEAESFEGLGDGEDYDKSAREIFGDKYDAFMNLDDSVKEEARKQSVADYAKATDLGITAYQDFEGAPVVVVAE